MKRRRMNTFAALTLAGALIAPVACSDSGVSMPEGSGTLSVRLTDAPFSTDSVQRVDVFVVRVDVRAATTDDDDANANVDDGSHAGWRTVAEPNASFDLLTLQHGASVSLGAAPIPAGTYNGLRLIIDPSQSSVTLKNGRVLTGSSSPGVKFPSASHSGLKIIPADPVTIVGGATTTLLVDFDVNKSFVQRGNSIDQNGLLFKPVIKASIIDAATVNATIRFANAVDSTMMVEQNGSVLPGGGALAFGASSSCSGVNAAAPMLSAILAGTTTSLPGLAPVLTPGVSYTLLAYPGASAVMFATLANDYTPAAGEAGLRVFNASSGATGIDVHVTANGAPLATPTIANTLTGAASSFVSVPAGASQVRLAAAGSPAVLLDLGDQSFAAGTTTTLVVAPALPPATQIRAFLVPGC